VALDLASFLPSILVCCCQDEGGNVCCISPIFFYRIFGIGDAMQGAKGIGFVNTRYKVHVNRGA
jgi:hypothetical protein